MSNNQDKKEKKSWASYIPSFFEPEPDEPVIVQKSLGTLIKELVAASEKNDRTELKKLRASIQPMIDNADKIVSNYFENDDGRIKLNQRQHDLRTLINTDAIKNTPLAKELGLLDAALYGSFSKRTSHSFGGDL